CLAILSHVLRSSTPVSDTNLQRFGYSRIRWPEKARFHRTSIQSPGWTLASDPAIENCRPGWPRPGADHGATTHSESLLTVLKSFSPTLWVHLNNLGRGLAIKAL